MKQEKILNRKRFNLEVSHSLGLVYNSVLFHLKKYGKDVKL